ncbi:MAG: glycine cleavage T C-terminal barrel domain-containing protein [Halobacteriaceae archaeon]
MTVARTTHDDFGATFLTVGGRDYPARYGRPDSAVRAVRNGVGVTEHPADVLVLDGPGRRAALDGVIDGSPPDEEGGGAYGLLVEDGAITADVYAFEAGDRLLCLLPAGTADRATAALTAANIGGSDCTVEDATDRFGVFGVHGPSATEKLASVLNSAGTPADRLAFVRGSIRDCGVTAVRGDGLAAEEGFLVVTAAADAPDVFDSLLAHGLNAAPFGRLAWSTLTLEAGTPLFETELDGRPPDAIGLDRGEHAVTRTVDGGASPASDCRLAGFVAEDVPAEGATIRWDGTAVGRITRGGWSPTREAAVALGFVGRDYLTDRGGGEVPGTDGETTPVAVAQPPFVDGGERSGRLPDYPQADGAR